MPWQPCSTPAGGARLDGPQAAVHSDSLDQSRYWHQAGRCPPQPAHPRCYFLISTLPALAAGFAGLIERLQQLSGRRVARREARGRPIGFPQGAPQEFPAQYRWR